jgi:sec-independent protein translocase protein TatB
MPSLGDSAVIFILALLLFGPKKLPELARQLGKLMGEFRRASNEFRMQMEDELRMAEQADQQKKIAAMEAAAPVTPAITDGTENTIANTEPSAAPAAVEEIETTPSFQPSEAAIEPLPIASSGELNMMPPSTGLPEARSSVSHAFDSVPHVPDPELNTPVSTEEFALQQKPDRHQTHDIEPSTTEASLHG